MTSGAPPGSPLSEDGVGSASGIPQPQNGAAPSLLPLPGTWGPGSPHSGSPTLDLPGTLHHLLDLGTLTTQSEATLPQEPEWSRNRASPDLGWGWTLPSKGRGVRPEDRGIVGG